MKPKIFILSILAICVLIACEKPIPPNENETTPQDTVTIDEFVPQWEYIFEKQDLYHQILLSFDDTINRMYERTTVLENLQSDAPHIFKDNGWIDYIMKEDTMYYVKSYSQEDDRIFDYRDSEGNPEATWKISYIGDTIMDMYYLGIMPADASLSRNRRFYRVNN